MSSNEAGDKNATRVCVTGAGGYVASWLIKFLLVKGYAVHGTVRNPEDEKNAHLKTLQNASENLSLFKADLMDYEGLCSATFGCAAVFHVACPCVPPGTVHDDPETEMIQPTITGTQNVLNACLEAKVKRVLVVSSCGAVMLNPAWPKDRPIDEECWTDTEFCLSIKNYYCLGKTTAELEALEYAKRGDLEVVTLCPSIIIGPMLQTTVNMSSLFLLSLMKDGADWVEDRANPFVDVRDVADALILLYEKQEAKGRYICTSRSVKTQTLVAILKEKHPNYHYPKRFTNVEDDMKFSSEKLQKLGWKFRPLEETIADSIRSYEERGLLSQT